MWLCNLSFFPAYFEILKMFISMKQHRQSTTMNVFPTTSKDFLSSKRLDKASSGYLAEVKRKKEKKGRKEKRKNIL